MSTATMTDIELQRDVLDELKWEPSVNAAHIGVSVKDGVVTLTGHVPSYAEKYAAERAAKLVHSVKAVANELDVKLPGSSHRTDEDIAAACVNAHTSVVSNASAPVHNRASRPVPAQLEGRSRSESVSASRLFAAVTGRSSASTTAW